eukprot:TRINITY_DN25588_c0_g2_i1.p1 TRINITY_DN25588_c0_g2~~TRINITY_DN25588_c0_g2_i1.p1  ORF type:complete len:275 (+),score=35.55 TRINITY_DN25588_c0_g2_i1:96-920(+)
MLRNACLLAFLSVVVTLLYPTLRALYANFVVHRHASSFVEKHVRLKEDSHGDLASNVTVERLSSKFPLFLFRGIISPREADFIVSTYTPYMYTCGVRSYLSCIELQIDLSRADHELLASIEQRFLSLVQPLFDAGALPPDDETEKEIMQFQLVRYAAGGGFSFHHDQTDEPMAATIMAYLTDSGPGGEGLGGETSFPDVNVKVIPRKGDVLLWSSCHENGRLNDLSLHSGEPVTAGFKFILNMFMSNRGLIVEKACKAVKNLQSRFPKRATWMA